MAYPLLPTPFCGTLISAAGERITLHFFCSGSVVRPLPAAVVTTILRCGLCSGSFERGRCRWGKLQLFALVLMRMREKGKKNEENRKKKGVITPTHRASGGAQRGAQVYFIFAAVQTLFVVQRNEPFLPSNLHPCEGNPLKHRLTNPIYTNPIKNLQMCAAKVMENSTQLQTQNEKIVNLTQKRLKRDFFPFW